MTENADRLSRRDETLDVMKGILTILVVIGHGISLTEYDSGFLNSLIYAFHMPAFFIISGILHNQKKWEKKGLSAFVLKRIRTLIIPFLIMDVFAGSVKKIMIGKWVGLNIAGIAREILLLGWKTIRLRYQIITSWFLPVLFLSEILLFLSLKADRMLSANKKVRIPAITIAAGMISFVTVMMTYRTVTTRIMKLMITAMSAFLFLAAGYMAKNHYRKNFRPAVYIALACVMILCALYNGKPIMGSLEIRSFPVFVISGICGTIILLKLSRLCRSSLIALIGRKSLPVYGTHYLIRHIIKTCGYFAMPASFGTFLLYLLCVAAAEIILVPVFNALFRLFNFEKSTGFNHS